MGPSSRSKDQQESMHWKHKGPPTPETFRVEQSAGKFMATITEDTYASIRVALRENIKQKHRGKFSAGVLLLHDHDNAPAHKSRKSRAAIRKCGFVELNHLPYRQDLALSDYVYFIFRNLKKFLRGRRFSDDNAVKEAVTGYIDTKDVSFFSEGIQSLESKWTKCVTMKGGLH